MYIFLTLLQNMYYIIDHLNEKYISNIKKRTLLNIDSLLIVIAGSATDFLCSSMVPEMLFTSESGSGYSDILSI